MVFGPYVTLRQIEVVSKLERFKEKHGKGMTVSELSKQLGVLRQSVSQQLLRMLEKGLVTRDLDQSEIRLRKNGTSAGTTLAWRWSPTAKGRRLL